MIRLVLIGIGVGAASAIMFVSAVSGTSVALVLACLAPLPILIAALGWSHWTALIGAAVGGVALGLVAGPAALLMYLVRVGLPAWWLGYLALLARPTQRPDGVEWYPIGSLVVWTSIVSTAVVVVMLLSLGFDVESLSAELRQMVQQVVRSLDRPPTGARFLLDYATVWIPPAFAISLTVLNLINLWLAARIVKVSGRLQRPVPDLPSMRFPANAPLLVGAAIAGWFLGGMTGVASSVLASSMLTAYAVLGFAVLHLITRGMNSRSFVLTGAYVAAFFWPVLALFALLGLIDTAFDLRGRVTRKQGPPTLPN